MNELLRAEALLRRAFDGDPWHGAAITEILADVGAAGASARPIASAHSIWEITLHVIAWREEVCRRLDGLGRRDLSGDDDWPAVENRSQEAWEGTVRRLAETQRGLLAALGKVSRTQAGASSNDASVYESLYGLLQHDAYHLGQIALLGKARRGPDRSTGVRQEGA